MYGFLAHRQIDNCVFDVPQFRSLVDTRNLFHIQRECILLLDDRLECPVALHSFWLLNLNKGLFVKSLPFVGFSFWMVKVFMT